MFLLADSQRLNQEVPSPPGPDFPSFLAAKKKDCAVPIRSQKGLDMCHLSWWQLGLRLGYDIPVQWTMVEGNLRNPRFYTRSFHALCSEQKTWKLDQLTSIHPTQSMLQWSNIGKVSQNPIVKLGTKGWLKKYQQKVPGKKASIYRNMCSNTFSTTTQPPLKWTSSPKFSKLVFNSYPVCFCVSTLCTSVLRTSSTPSHFLQSLVPSDVKPA